MTDVIVGGTLLSVTGLVFVYYTLWVIILPFVDEDQVYIHSWFPDPKLAVGLPLMAGVLGLASIGLFVGWVFLKAERKEKYS